MIARASQVRSRRKRDENYGEHRPKAALGCEYGFYTASLKPMIDDVLRAEVVAVFGSVPKPAMIAPHACAECDELVQDFAEFSGESLPDVFFEKHVWDLPLLSDEAKHYYLSAWLLRALPKGTWSDACDALVVERARKCIPR